MIIVGSKGMGEEYYGDGREGDCSGAKGFHCDPYEPRIYFYDPAELAEVAAGSKEPYEVLPYHEHNPATLLWPKCQQMLSDMTYDRAGRLLYGIQPKVDSENNRDRFPLIHVWRIEG